jgi:hypothetical protein
MLAAESMPDWNGSATLARAAAKCCFGAGRPGSPALELADSSAREQALAERRQDAAALALGHEPTRPTPAAGRALWPRSPRLPGFCCQRWVSRKGLRLR